MSDYFDFLNKYFPFVKSNKDFNTLYEIVCENNFLTDLYIKYIDLNTSFMSQENIIFLERYKIGINKLLLYVPINDGIGSNSCMRYSIEQLLKFFYSIYANETVSKVSTVRYRTMKEFFKNLEDITFKEEIKKLYTYYGKYSNDIHGKLVSKNNDSFQYLKHIIESDNKLVLDVTNDVNNIEKVYNKLINIKFNVCYDNLCAAERLNLDKILRKNMKIYIINLINN